ncbi:MAG: DNA-directed RNA polymerase [Nanoarchaeota archaeon]
MFYRVEVKDHIRVPPKLFDKNVEDAIIARVQHDYDGYISKELGIVVGVSKVKAVQEGVIIPGDGAPYYETVFELLTFKPELQEVIVGKIRDIADFGAFMSLGPIEGMIHVSQTMDDFVSFSKEKTLTGKESKKTLRVGDVCRARIIAISFKELNNPKLGLTMRQQGLGRQDWIDEEKK